MSDRARLGVATLLVLGLGAGAWWALAGSASDQSRVVASAHDALEAWGRFAVTGDLALLEGHFDPAGPQYRQLASESESLTAHPIGDPPFRFDLEAEEVRGSGSTVLVAGGVTVTRLGEPEQSLRWSIEMHLIGDRWQVWTVTSEKDSVTKSGL